MQKTVRIRKNPRSKIFKVLQRETSVYKYFVELNHKLTIERLKTRGKKDIRDSKKSSQRTLDSKVTTPAGKLEGKRANESEEQYLDRMLDDHDIKY